VTLLYPHPGGNGRGAKDYHLRLDADGQVTVSETVWSRIQEAEALGQWPERFVLVGTVSNPPPLNISTPGGTIEVVRTMKQLSGAAGKIEDATREEVDKIKEAVARHAPAGTRGRVEVQRRPSP
jgi:hypothetical protein